MNVLKLKDKSNIPLIAAIIIVLTVIFTIAASSFVWQFAERGIRDCYESGGRSVDMGWDSVCIHDK